MSNYYFTNSAGEKYLIIFGGTTTGDCRWMKNNYKYPDYFICHKIIGAMERELGKDTRCLPREKIRKLYNLVKKFETED